MKCIRDYFRVRRFKEKLNLPAFNPDTGAPFRWEVIICTKHRYDIKTGFKVQIGLSTLRIMEINPYSAVRYEYDYRKKELISRRYQ